MDLFDLVAKITLDSSGYESSLNSAGAKLSGFGKSVSSGFGSVLNGVTQTAKGAAIAVGAAATAAAGVATKITTDAVKAYAEFEQLSGGAALMFGSAYDSVAERAANAYATVQMSQNEYLQQVNGFATGLKTAMGGNEQAAADLADKIITAEADVVAATGASQEAVQNAFNGIMKSNFTMLDNLQLGITPTKEGFQEVIDKVNEWNATNGNATDYQMGNLADMQSALVDYIDMVGVAGYAQEEAAGTIEGSLASTRAAWRNLLTGMGTGKDINGLVANLTKSAKNAFNNILPVAKSALSGIGTAISELGPAIIEELPGIVAEVIPAFQDATGSILDAVVDQLPEMADVGGDLIGSLISGVADHDGAITDSIGRVTETIISGLLGVGENIPDLIDLGFDVLGAVGGGISSAVESAGGLTGLAEGAAEIVNKLSENIGEFINDPTRDWGEIGADVGEAITTAMNDINWEQVGTNISGFVSGLKDFILGLIESIHFQPGEIMHAILAGMFPEWDKRQQANIAREREYSTMSLGGGAPSNGGVLGQDLSFLDEWESAGTADGKGYTDSFAQSVTAGTPGVATAVNAMTTNAGALIEAFSTSASDNGETAITNYGESIIQKEDYIEQSSERIGEAAANPLRVVASDMYQSGADAMINFARGVSANRSVVKNAVVEVANDVAANLAFSEPDEGPLSNFHAYAPDMMELFAQGIRDNERMLRNQVQSTFDFGDLTTSRIPSVGGGSDGGEIVTLLRMYLPLLQNIGMNNRYNSIYDIDSGLGDLYQMTARGHVS